MTTDDLVGTTYWMVAMAFGLGSYLFLRRLGPPRKKYWHARLSLVAILLFGLCYVAFVIVWQHWTLLLFLPVILTWAAYMSHTRMRVCEQCGKIVQPDSMLTAAQYCPRCGDELSPARLSVLLGLKPPDRPN